jgi:hypothetical protein
MKPISPSIPAHCVKLAAMTLLVAAFHAAAPVQAQSLITDSAFFDPDFEARRPGTGLVLSLQVDTTFYTPAAESSGNTTWEHSAAGLVQLGADVFLVGTVDVQLAAYTRTTGNTLVFGRELETTTTGLLGSLGPTITSVTDQVLGVSAINSWASTADVTGLSLTQGQNYLVSFNVQSGAGIDLNALSAANFSLLNGGNPIQDINTNQTANILNILQLGGGLATIEFEFQAASPFTDLTFQFDAATVADANLLGSISGNQTVLEFSNFSLSPVPEPGTLFLASLGVLVILRRHRFRAVGTAGKAA